MIVLYCVLIFIAVCMLNNYLAICESHSTFSMAEKLNYVVFQFFWCRIVKVYKDKQVKRGILFPIAPYSIIPTVLTHKKVFVLWNCEETKSDNATQTCTCSDCKQEEEKPVVPSNTCCNPCTCCKDEEKSEGNITTNDVLDKKEEEIKGDKNA